MDLNILTCILLTLYLVFNPIFLLNVTYFGIQHFLGQSLRFCFLWRGVFYPAGQSLWGAFYPEGQSLRGVFYPAGQSLRGAFYPEGQSLRGAFYPEGQSLRLTSSNIYYILFRLRLY